jgi:hypothetical protein
MNSDADRQIVWSPGYGALWIQGHIFGWIFEGPYGWSVETARGDTQAPGTYAQALAFLTEMARKAARMESP